MKSAGWIWMSCALALACKTGEPRATKPPVPAPMGAAEVAGEPQPEPRPPGTIYRSEVERATGRGPAHLLRQLGPEPFRDRGKFAGWTITRLFPDDPGLCGSECDLQAGDVIVSVNGNRMERPEQLSQLLEELPGSSELTVVRVRGDETSSHVYVIAEGR